MDHLFRKTVKNDPVETGNSDPLITGIGDPVGLELLIHYDWNMQLYEYSVLVTDLNKDVISIVQLYRDRADCENNFDELKNHWGWGGFTTQKMHSTQMMARIVALIYNWWSLFVRLINPGSHLEAITSRPLLLSSIGKLTKSGRQKFLKLTHSHAHHQDVAKTYQKVMQFFEKLKSTSQQLTKKEYWQLIIEKIIEQIGAKKGLISITSSA